MTLQIGDATLKPAQVEENLNAIVIDLLRRYRNFSNLKISNGVSKTFHNFIYDKQKYLDMLEQEKEEYLKNKKGLSKGKKDKK